MKFVFPGDRIGYAEEYLVGEGVYEENGEIFASIAGTLEIKNKVVSVKSVKEIPELKRGDVVLGRVVDLRNSIALVEIARKEGVDRELKHTGIAALHISNVRNEYLKDFNNSIGYMDVLKARIIDSELLKLSTKEKEMGVLKAYCSSCKSEMILEGNKLKCIECGRVEGRKLSSDYGKGNWR
jgi:exosome complex component CSL4